MITHDARGSKRSGLSRLRLWARSRPRAVQVLVIAGAFGVGAVASQMEIASAVKAGLGLNDRNLALARSFVRHPASTFDHVLRGPRLPTLHIDMGLLELERIRGKRAEALGAGHLISDDEDFVPATIRLDDQSIRVRMRLKGNMLDHVAGDKWSYRIHVRGDDHVFGMRRFSIQHPGTRNYLAEWGWHENLRLEGVLAPRYLFANVVLNGMQLGVFALEEHFSTEIMEAHGRQEGVILAFEEGYYWDRRVQLGLEPTRFDQVHRGGHRHTDVNTRRSGSVAGDPDLARQRDAAVDLLRGFQDGDMPGSAVFDAELLGRFLALSELWEARHGLIWNNVQFYYNPITARIEPISFDGEAQIYRDIYTGPALYALLRPWAVEALRDPVVAEAYVAELERISRPEYLEWLRGQIFERYKELQLAMSLEFPAVRAARVWEALAEQQGKIRRSLDVSQQVLPLAVAGWGSAGGPAPADRSYRIQVRNVLSLPVEVLAFQVGSDMVPASGVWSGGEGSDYTRGDRTSLILPAAPALGSEPLGYAEFRVPFPSSGPPPGPDQIAVVTRLLGHSAHHTAPVLNYPERLRAARAPEAPSVEEVLRRHAFVERGESRNTLRVRSGTWDVDGDLVFPAGVTVEAGPGTALRFERDAVLLARGPLQFHGSYDSPVHLAPRDSTWAGVVVLHAGAPSSWSHVVVESTHGVSRDGWMPGGGTTFYDSPIELDRVAVVGSTAPEAIHVARTSFDVRSSVFRRIAFSAFRSNWAEGTIRGTTFLDVGGDAVDLTGSQVRLREVALDRIGGVAISAGEGSDLEAGEVLIRAAGVGIASRDRSVVQLRGARIAGARNAGLAAYTAKPEHGPGTIRAFDVEFEDTPVPTLAQSGGTLVLDHRVMESAPLNVWAAFELAISSP